MTTTKAKKGRDPAAIEATLNALAEEVGADEYELPEDAQVRTPAPGEGRTYLEQFVSPNELDRVNRGGRPSLSGAGTSPKRQVRLPADLDALLVQRAATEGRPLSDVLREAVASYLRPPAA